MAQIQIPGTSITFSNPKQLNSAAIDPKTGAAWAPAPVPAPGALISGAQLTYSGPATPQPGSFDSNAPTANPVLFGKQPPSLSTGGIAIANSSTVVKNPA